MPSTSSSIHFPRWISDPIPVLAEAVNWPKQTGSSREICSMFSENLQRLAGVSASVHVSRVSRTMARSFRTLLQHRPEVGDLDRRVGRQGAASPAGHGILTRIVLHEAMFQFRNVV